jgi:hypothetical protein
MQYFCNKAIIIFILKRNQKKKEEATGLAVCGFAE